MSTSEQEKHNQAERGLPVYDSMRQCVLATGIPFGVLKKAKMAGCPAFEWNRVYLARLLPWLFTREAKDAGVDWSTELRKMQAQREKIRLARDEGTVVERSEVVEAIVGSMATFFGELTRVFTRELPPALKGLDESRIAERNHVEIERVKDTVRSRLSRLIDSNVANGTRANNRGARKETPAAAT
jgi:hypothetical protein